MTIFGDLTIRASDDWTVLEIMDLQGEQLRVAHWHPSPKLIIHLPSNRSGFHSRDLSRSQARSLGTRLLRFSRTGFLEDPNPKDDFQI